MKKNKENRSHEKNVIETILLSIRTFDPSTNVKINVQCSDEEEMRFTGLLGESQKVFAWSYEDLCGFDPGLVRHTIKLAGQKQELVNSALKAPFRRGLRDFLRAGMFFSVHPEWVPNRVPASKITNHTITCVHLRIFSQSIMSNPSPSLYARMIMQQVVELQLNPLLDSLFGYSKIKLEKVNFHKTTLITNCDTMPYNCMPSRLFDASTAFKRPIHTTFSELVSLHAYLDDLIVFVKGLIITLEFQVLGHFHITFVLDTNS
jgi:hypothetical protein